MAIAFVQSGTNRAIGAVSKAFTSNNTAGNLIAVAILLEHSTDTISSVADTRGNTYALAGSVQGSAGSGYQAAIYYAKNIAAGANTVTVTPTTGSTPVDIAIHEYSGADTTAPLDQTASATGISTTPSSGSATTTAANELIFGVIIDNAAVTVDASLTTRHDFTFNYFSYSVDKIGATAGSYAVNGTAASNRWVAAMATFKPLVVVASTQSYDEFIASDAAAPVVLAEAQLAEALGPWTLESGVVYRAPWADIVQTSVVAGGLYRRLDFVRENATTYTSVGSIVACQALASSYFHDPAADLIYVHTSTGSSPNTFALVGAWFTIFLSTTTVQFSGQPLYLPLISGLPSHDAEMPDTLFGATISDVGDVELSNTAGLFDKLARLWIWRNKSMTFKLGSTSMAYADFATVMTMRINGIHVGEDVARLALEDKGSALNKSLPFRTWADASFGLTPPDGVSGQSAPIVFGTVFNAPMVPLDVGGVLEIWGGYDIFENDVVLITDVYAVDRVSRTKTPLTNGIDYTASTTLTVTNSTYFYATHDIMARLSSTGPYQFGSITLRLLQMCGVPDNEIDTAAFTAVAASAPQILSHLIREPQQAADIVRELEVSVFGQVYRGLDGKWTCRTLVPDLPADPVILSDADFARWDPVSDPAAVLNEVSVRFWQQPALDDWREVSSSDGFTEYAHEAYDSHRIDTWLVEDEDASVQAERLRFFRSLPPNRFEFEERGLSLMTASVGDLVKVTKSRAPVARTGRYDGHLMRIVKLRKQLGPGVPTVSGTLDDIDGQTDRVARLADTSMTWSTATSEQRAVYGFLADSNGYIDAADVTTRNLKVVI